MHIATLCKLTVDLLTEYIQMWFYLVFDGQNILMYGGTYDDKVGNKVVELKDNRIFA